MPSDNHSPTIQWTSATSNDAADLSRQGQALDDARRRTAGVDYSGRQGAPDWANIAPPGVDPQQYVRDMVGRSGGADTAKYLTSEKITQQVPPPSTLVIRPKHGGTQIAANAAGPTDIVDVDLGNGETVQIACALAAEMGLIKQDRDGGYKALSAGEVEDAREADRREQQEKAAKEAADISTLRESGDEPDETTNQAIEAVVSRIPGQAVTAMVNDFVENWSLSLDNVTRVAAQAGLAPEQATHLATNVVEGIRRQADKAVVSSGVPAGLVDEAYQWMQQNYPREHAVAVRSLALASKAAPLKDLTAKYLSWVRGQAR